MKKPSRNKQPPFLFFLAIHTDTYTHTHKDNILHRHLVIRMNRYENILKRKENKNIAIHLIWLSLQSKFDLSFVLGFWLNNRDNHHYYIDLFIKFIRIYFIHTVSLFGRDLINCVWGDKELDFLPKIWTKSNRKQAIRSNRITFELNFYWNSFAVPKQATNIPFTQCWITKKNEALIISNKTQPRMKLM